VHTEATNTNDGKALHNVAIQAKENLQLQKEQTLMVLADKGYQYQFVFARNAGHCDGPTKQQTLAGALEYLWQGYPKLP